MKRLHNPTCASREHLPCWYGLSSPQLPGTHRKPRASGPPLLLPDKPGMNLQPSARVIAELRHVNAHHSGGLQNRMVFGTDTFCPSMVILTNSILYTVGSSNMINFCANNYLGLANHPELIAAAKADGQPRFWYGFRALYLRYAG